MKSTRAEFNFVLLFAIIAGSAILVLAIYGAVKAGTGQQIQQSAELAKQIDIITDPLQAGFAATSTSTITFPKETRISNICSQFNDFGENAISIQAKSSVGESWLEETIPIRMKNKYIYSESEEAKKYYVMSKPFEFPFKIADLLFITSKNYCLIDPPEDIAQSMLSLKASNMGIKTGENDTCQEESETVCFGFGNCDISIIGDCYDCESEYEYGMVRKGSDQMYYVGNLMYAAIFSDKANYDCNFDRLMFRLSMISKILSEKTDLMNTRGCNTLMKTDLEYLAETARLIKQEEIKNLYETVKLIKEKEEGSIGTYSGGCGVW